MGRMALRATGASRSAEDVARRKEPDVGRPVVGHG